MIKNIESVFHDFAYYAAQLTKGTTIPDFSAGIDVPTSMSRGNKILEKHRCTGQIYVSHKYVYKDFS